MIDLLEGKLGELEQGSDEWFSEICNVTEKINYLINRQSGAGLVHSSITKYIPSQIQFAEKFAESECATEDRKVRLCELIVSGIKSGKKNLKESGADMPSTFSQFDIAVTDVEKILL